MEGIGMSLNLIIYSVSILSWEIINIKLFREGFFIWIRWSNWDKIYFFIWNFYKYRWNMWIKGF